MLRRNLVRTGAFFGLSSFSRSCTQTCSTAPVAPLASAQPSKISMPHLSCPGLPFSPKRFFREAAGDADGKRAIEEKEELEKDEKFFYNMLKIGFLIISLSFAFPYMNRWAKKQYWFTEEGSVRVSLTSRGKPSLGGPFSLVNTDGVPVSQADYLGSWTFFYFGFVHCPEICPIELNRMSKVVDRVMEKKPKTKIQPLFVTCDPKRDSLLAIKEYLSVFHKDFIGLVGTPEQVDETCKSYRIYYSIPDDSVVNEGDYLIDHSIAIFLFDPKGRFVDFFGNRYNEDEICERVLTYMTNYEKDDEWTNW